jgi:phage regulator Rha-like protein
MVAIQNLTKQMTEFTNKINKKFDEREKATQARLKQIEQVARYGKR